MRFHLVIAVLVVLPFVAVAGSLPFSRFGMIDTPSSALLNHTEVAFGASGTVYSIEDSSGTSDMNVTPAGYIEIGLFGRAQIGGTYLGAGGFSGTVRGLILSQTMTRPGISIGVENLTGEKDYDFYRNTEDSLYHYPNSQNFSVYGLISKDFSYYVSFPVCLNIGYGTGRFVQSSEAVDGFENPIPGLFGSILIHPSIASDVLVEWDGRDLNAGAVFRVNRNFTVRAAVAELEHIFTTQDSTANAQDVMQHTKFTVGLQFNFGPFLNRTELDPYQRLRYTDDDEALEMLKEYRVRAREEIQEMESTIH